MIILDTNVLSELMKAAPDPGVLNWLRSQPSASLFTTSIAQAEIHYGLSLLPAGKRRTDLEQTVREMFAEDFAGRVLPFGSPEAIVYGAVAATRRLAGRPVSQPDAQIAAIALTSGAILATRNVSDFENLELRLINPWMS